MSDELHRLVYCSRGSEDLSPEATRAMLLSILEASRRNNARFGITGALLFSGGIFAQVLEGALPGIERTFEHIQRDRRHSEVTVLQVERSGHREFGEWAMAYAGGSGSAHPLAAMTLKRAFTAEPGDTAQQVLTMLEQLVRAEEVSA